MEKLVCPKCGKEVPDSVSICTSCGTRVREKVAKPVITPEEDSKRTLSFALIMLMVGILGLFVMYSYRAWLGCPIYLISAGITYLELKKIYDKENKMDVGQFVKDCFTVKGIGEKIMMAMVVVAPIIAVIGVYRWIVVDSARFVESIMP